MNQPDRSGNAAGPLPVPPALVILLLGLILTLPSFFLRDLWNPDEPRYAEVSREMVVLNDYLVPHLNGEIYAEKPPLFFWLSAFFQALGFGVRAGRIVTAFAVMGTLFLTWALARLWFPPPTPLLSVLILATAFQFLWLGRVGVLDVPLGFFILMAVYGFCRFRRDGGWWAVLFYGGMGLATLTKGPVGILIICLGAISVAMFTEAPRRGRTLHILWGAPLTAAIICAWLIPASIQGGPEYRNIILFQQNIGRMVSSWSHARPWYYYFTTLPVHFFPWCLFVPWALVWLWRKGKSYCGGGGRCLILWFCLGFLAFSIISGKRGRYLIPLLPALAICVAVFLDAVARSAAAGKLRVWGRRLLLFQNSLFLPLGFLPILFLVRGSKIAISQEAKDPEIAALILGALAWPSNAGFLLLGASMLAVAFIGIRFAAGNRVLPSILSIAGAMIVFSVGLDFVLAPQLDRVKSGREISRRADEMVPPEGEGQVALYPKLFSGALHVYSRRVQMPVLTTPAEVDQFLSAPGDGIIITSRKYLQRDAAKFLAPYAVIEVKRLGGRKMVFLTKPPPPPLE